MKKILLFLLIIFGLFVLQRPLLAKEEPLVIHLFWSQGCPHCSKEKDFLLGLKERYSLVRLKTYEISHSNQNQEIMEQMARRLNVNVPGVPFTVIGDQYIIGYQSDQTTGKQIEEIIKNRLGEPDRSKISIPDEVKIPVIGSLKIKELSLPVLSIVLGVLDGFNPCAMWTLLFLISLLLGMKDKTRMWILGVTFVVASGLVYFLIMSAWLNFFLLLGLVGGIQIAIGLVALAAGGYNLREFWVNKDGGCKVTGNKKRRKVFEKLKDITHQRNFWLALGGIILLAFAVNVVELVCSAGLPAVFTQVLALNSLAKWRYYLYIALYIVFFLIDDLFVFFAAMITMEMTGISTKYSRYSHLVGGILMLILGGLLVFKPELLMLG